MNARELLGLSPVMPVLVIDDEGTAVDLAGALLEGGLGAVEITLRTPAALPAVRRIADEQLLLASSTTTGRGPGAHPTLTKGSVGWALHSQPKRRSASLA